MLIIRPCRYNLMLQWVNYHFKCKLCALFITHTQFIIFILIRVVEAAHRKKHYLWIKRICTWNNNNLTLVQFASCYLPTLCASFSPNHVALGFSLTPNCKWRRSVFFLYNILLCVWTNASCIVVRLFVNLSTKDHRHHRYNFFLEVFPPTSFFTGNKLMWQTAFVHNMGVPLFIIMEWMSDFGNISWQKKLSMNWEKNIVSEAQSALPPPSILLH